MPKCKTASAVLAPVPSKGRKRNAKSRLTGCSVLVIGGDQRNFAIQKFRKELGLQDVIWLPTREADPSSKAFRYALWRQRPGLVIALIGLMRHQHARDIKNACCSLGIPFMAIRRSLSAAQVADAWENNRFSR